MLLMFFTNEFGSIDLLCFILLSLAPVGGLIEPNEEPEEAARRELLEEAGLGKS